MHGSSVTLDRAFRGANRVTGAEAEGESVIYILLNFEPLSIQTN